MSEALMNGPSPFTRAERELIFAYAAGVAGCEFVYVAHSEVAYALGVEPGLVEKLLHDGTAASSVPRLKPVLNYVRKLVGEPHGITSTDVERIYDAGWNDHAFHDMVALTARAAFMQRLVEGYGFTPMSRAAAAKRAVQRIEAGYVNLYPEFRATPE